MNLHEMLKMTESVAYLTISNLKYKIEYTPDLSLSEKQKLENQILELEQDLLEVHKTYLELIYTEF